VCLIADGVAETSSQRKLGGYPVRLPMAAVESIGAGGGSIAHVDAAGALRVGPRSAGAQPGPACYGLGGTEATVTDADLLLGCLVSPLRYDAVRTYRGLLSAWDAKPADHRLRELQEQCVAPLTDEGIALDRIAVQWSADLRYSGQNYEIEIPWRDTPEALRAEF